MNQIIFFLIFSCRQHVSFHFTEHISTIGENLSSFITLTLLTRVSFFTLEYSRISMSVYQTTEHEYCCCRAVVHSFSSIPLSRSTKNMLGHILLTIYLERFQWVLIGRSPSNAAIMKWIPKLPSVYSIGLGQKGPNCMELSTNITRNF